MATAVDDLIMTIDSDEEDSSTSLPKKSSKAVEVDVDNATLNLEFSFDLTVDPYAGILAGQTHLSDVVAKGSKPEPISVDDIIARRKLNPGQNKRKRGPEGEEAEVFSDLEKTAGNLSDNEEDFSADVGGKSDDIGDDEEDPLATSEEDEQDGSWVDMESEGEAEEDSSDSSPSSDDSEEESQMEKDRKAAFFSSNAELAAAHSSFLTMNLSRPILKALTSLSFHTPTPIQTAAIPVALMGKDVVGGAVTGSGKTAAFIIPMLERLLYRDRGKKAAATRCLVLVPTRELAVQCFEVGSKLAAHTDVRFCLIVGGLSVKSQEAALRSRPDVLIATPGRLIDHLRNSPSFTLDTLDVLILDEADRMLSDGFHDELSEIIKSCPSSRQTMLFSATMTDSVDDLIKMSLKQPVRLFVDPKRSIARGLVQEFVRVRAGKEAERSALLVALCKRTFKTKVIIFFRSKKLAHQMRVVFGVLGMNCEELHGDLTQEQRLTALQRFRDGFADYLMATDLASRGLDIKSVETVINYDMPGQLAQYLHRVGRTARAGNGGRSVTLVGEADRKMLKVAIKHGAGEDQIRHRIIPPEAVLKWMEVLEGLRDEVAAVLKEEIEEKAIRRAEMELKKGQNMMEHEQEIFSRPARTWFQTEKEKLKAEDVSKNEYEAQHNVAKQGKPVDANKPKRDKLSGLTRKAKRRKLTMEEDQEMGDNRALKAAIRSAKKAARPAKIGDPAVKLNRVSGRGKKKARKKATNNRQGTFDADMGNKINNHEGMRARKGDVIGSMGRKKVGNRKGKGK